MSTALEQEGISVAQYLEGELATEVKHEYVNGALYAMGGASREHNLIAGNLFAALHGYLRVSPCQTFMADMKVHLQLGSDELFYYPDAVVGCDAGDDARYYLERPRFITEVASRGTERLDRREKLLAYTRLDLLAAYLILDQDRLDGLLCRAATDWVVESLALADSLSLPDLAFELPMREIYAGVVE